MVEGLPRAALEEKRLIRHGLRVENISNRLNDRGSENYVTSGFEVCIEVQNPCWKGMEFRTNEFGRAPFSG